MHFKVKIYEEPDFNKGKRVNIWVCKESKPCSIILVIRWRDKAEHEVSYGETEYIF